MHVKLVLVSIGKPEIAKNLIQHLDIPNGEAYLYVDPENVLYDALHLNRGIKETFFSPSTPLAFLDRFTRPDGMKELRQVMSKWNKGTSTTLWKLCSYVFTSQRGMLTMNLLVCFVCVPTVPIDSHYRRLAVYLPPKQSQAFNQGGTFLFDGAETVFAHYDESTGAHSSIQQVIDLAKERVERSERRQ